MTQILILAILLIMSGSCQSWKLPPSKFILDFSHIYNRFAVIHHLPNDNQPTNVVGYFKSFSYNDQNMAIPVLLSHQDTMTRERVTDEELHVFILDGNSSVYILKEIFLARLLTNKEFWLIDVGHFDTIENTTEALGDIILDIDDDVFLYSNTDNEVINIWEVYKIAAYKELKLLYHGNWSSLDGFMLTKQEKWARRSDLQVI
jgi:hypothetical protein